MNSKRVHVLNLISSLIDAAENTLCGTVEVVTQVARIPVDIAYRLVDGEYEKDAKRDSDDSQ